MPHAQSAPNCSVAGIIQSGRIPLPGVVVSIADADRRVLDVAASGTDGAYAVKIPGAGRYTLTAELVAFAPLARELTIDPASCQSRVDLSLTLASRAPKTDAPAPRANSAPATAVATTPAAPIARTPAASGRRDPAAARRSRSGAGAAVSESRAARRSGRPRAGRQRGSPTESAAQVLLPPGFSPDTSAESVTAIGSSQANAGFFGPNGRAISPSASATASAATARWSVRRARTVRGGRGGPGGFAGGRGGLGGPFGGPFGGRGGRGNQIRGTVFQSLDSSVLDTAPFALNGQPTMKPDYLQQRLGATLGGPLVIPNLVNSPRTFFFVNYTGNHSRNPYDAYSTVPTLADARR